MTIRHKNFSLGRNGSLKLRTFGAKWPFTSVRALGPSGPGLMMGGALRAPRGPKGGLRPPLSNGVKARGPSGPWVGNSGCRVRIFPFGKIHYIFLVPATISHDFVTNAAPGVQF